MATSTNIPFCFRIRCIRPNYAVQDEQCFANGYWKPLTLKNAYIVGEDTGWRYWRPSQCITIPPTHHVVRYNSISMFWGSDRQAFLAVPYDCTAESVRTRANASELDDWRRLRFDHVERPDGTCISVLQEYEQNHRIGGTNSGNWMPELLPYCYRYEPNGAPEFSASSLGGRLAILLALAVFSRDPATMGLVSTIRNHFRPDGYQNWRPHNTTEESNARKFKKENSGRLCLMLK